jgi:hypothetical protein
MASEADVNNVANDPLLPRLRGAEDESNILLSVKSPVWDREIEVSSVFLHERPQGGLYLVTDLVKFVHVGKGHEVVS